MPILEELVCKRPLHHMPTLASMRVASVSLFCFPRQPVGLSIGNQILNVILTLTKLA